MTEASAMEKYAVENNLIDPEHIIKEEKASSTAENAYYSRIIIDEFEASNVHVVTTELHMERTKKFFEKVWYRYKAVLKFAFSLIDYHLRSLKKLRPTEMRKCCLPKYFSITTHIH